MLGAQGGPWQTRGKRLQLGWEEEAGEQGALLSPWQRPLSRAVA